MKRETLYVEVRTSKGVPFLVSPEINGLIPLFSKNKKLFSYVPCSPITSLFLCSPEINALSPVPQNHWEGLRS